MAKSPNAQSVKASRAAAGVKSTSLYLGPEERALWERVARERGVSKTEAMVAGLLALDKGAPDPTPEQALRVLERAVKRRTK